MNKILQSAALLLIASAQIHAAPTDYRCNFNNGIPADFSLYDEDNLEPSQDVKVYGFEQGIPWTAVKLSDSHLTAAASTSWYKSAGQSSDWMVLPKLKIEGKSIHLKWAARAHDAKFSDGYAVYVSDKGCKPTDFDTTAPLFSIDAENGEWTVHTLPLSDYEGKEIYIAFVNNSADRALLYIDDIEVAEDRDLEADRMLPGILRIGETLGLKGDIRNTGDKEFTGIDMQLEIEGQNFSLSNPQAKLAAGESTALELATDFTPANPGIYAYTLTIKAGTYTITREGNLYVTRRNILVEEGTGTWCGYCPRGAVAMKNMSEKYPDQFIGVAVHAGKDPMAVPGYSVRANSYPTCIVNRLDKFQGNPDNMEEYFLEARKAPAKAAIFGRATYSETGNTLSIAASAAFEATQDGTEYGISYILKELDSLLTFS